MPIPYNKPPLTPEQQADLLLSRGLRGISKPDLVKKLESVSYYRLRGYTYPYQDASTSIFLANANWDHIWSDYLMDSRLRSVLFESIGHIEIAFRTQLELAMSAGYGSRWYEKDSFFFNKTRHTRDLSELSGDWARSDEDFKRHYEEKYDPDLMPPAWMIFETSTFGLVSKFYDNIDSSLPEKAVVARFFGFSKAAVPVLVSWMRHLTNLRNICAHHSRLYIKTNIVKPKFPRKIDGDWVTSWPDSGKIYASVCIVKKLLDACSIEYDFVSELKKIMRSVRVEQLESMGFPNDWDKEKLFC